MSAEDIAILYSDVKDLIARIKKIEKWIDDYERAESYKYEEGLGQI